MSTVGVVASLGLGDAFLSMVLGRNLQRMGHKVTIYSSALYQLSPWISWAEVRLFKADEVMQKEYESFDHVIAATRHRAFGKAEIVGVDRSLTMVAHFERYLQRKWGPTQPLTSADLAIPSNLVHRKYSKRVVLGATSTDTVRNWPGEKFVSLAECLRRDGFEPVFVMTPKEAPAWGWLEAHNMPVVTFSQLTDAVGYMVESGYFIGNDSGLGHVASFFHVPTLSLFARESFSRMWRPGWGPGRVVTSTIKLPGDRWQQKYWKYLLTVGKVLREFRGLRGEMEEAKSDER
jgi:ADP-heptose:LPS heptosyltransferase